MKIRMKSQTSIAGRSEIQKMHNLVMLLSLPILYVIHNLPISAYLLFLLLLPIICIPLLILPSSIYVFLNFQTRYNSSNVEIKKLPKNDQLPEALCEYRQVY